LRRRRTIHGRTVPANVRRRVRIRLRIPSSCFSHSVGFPARRSRVGNRSVAVGEPLVDGAIRVKFIGRWISSI
jgi:hypothetical protein